MANTVLSNYTKRLEELQSKIKAGTLPLPELFIFQELNYRVSVLQTMQAFCRTAPLTTDIQPLGFHYQQANSYMQGLLSEHRYGLKPDEKGMKRRETALSAFRNIYADNCKRFSSFAPSSPDQYKSSLSSMINTVLPAWLQYRETYVPVDEQKGAVQS